MIFFFGADHKAGTTMVVHGLAAVLAEHVIEKEVLVIGLANNPDDEYSPPNICTIENLLPVLDQEKEIPFQMIEDQKVFQHQYSFIPGSRNWVKYRQFSVQLVEQLLKQLEEENRYIILLDAGSEIDSPLFLGGMKASNLSVALLNDQWTAYMALKRKVKQVIEPAFLLTEKDFWMVLNKFDEDRSAANQKIAPFLEGTVHSTLPFSGYHTMADVERKLLVEYDQELKASLVEFARLLAKKQDWPFKEVERQPQGSFFSKMKQRMS